MKRKHPNPLCGIDKWFKGRCNNLWEHQSGLKLETTDNPGWLMTVDEAIDELIFSNLSIEVQKRWGAECIREHDIIKIYAISLQDCVYAAAHILETVKKA